MPNKPQELDGTIVRDWYRKQHQAPRAAYRLMMRAVDHVLPKNEEPLPFIVYVPVPTGTASSFFGGRHYPNENVIAVYRVADRDVVQATLLHETAHFIRKCQGDWVGYHDKAFYGVVERLFRWHGVSRDVARFVEQICSDPGSPCAHW